MVSYFFEKPILKCYERIANSQKPKTKKHPLSVEVKVPETTSEPRYWSIAFFSLFVLWHCYYLVMKEMLWVTSIKMQILIQFLLSRGHSWIYNHCFHQEKSFNLYIAQTFFAWIIFVMYSRLLVHLYLNFDAFMCFFISLQGFYIVYKLIFGSRDILLVIYRSPFIQRFHTRHSYPPFFSIISKHKTYQKCGFLRQLCLNKQLLHKARKENLHYWART